MKNLLFLLIVSLFLGCSDPIEVENSADIQGEFMGTFERNGIVSNVTLNILNGNFLGETEDENQQSPRICNGTYAITTNNLVFTNNCFWIADFDWSLILNNTWHYNLRNNTLTLIKENGDTYILTRQ